MNFKLLISYLLVLGSLNIAVGQNFNSIKTSVSPVPNEEVFMQVNSSLLFVGEYLYYKIYVKNVATNTLSKLSKIGYVELLQENGKLIFKHQLILENGLGQGDFFIPTDVVSGNYKIVSYTQNMLSKSDENFFQQDISIINPYKGDQSAITENFKEEDSISSLETNNKIEQNTSKENKQNSDFSIDFDKGKYTERSEINVSILTDNEAVSNGNYSISVRKKDEIEVPQLKFSNAPRETSKTKNLKNGATKQLLPEIRGKLISGKIVSKASDNPLKSRKVTLSIPGDDYVFKVADVSADGTFYFNIDKAHSQNNALFQVIGDTSNNFQIILDSLPSINKGNIKFNKFMITPKMEKMILNRSIQNQVENAFYRVKPDTIKTLPLEKAYYGKTFTTYVLDDYTRFPTMKETMIEIVDNAWLQTDSDGHSEFKVREPEGYGRRDYPLLLLVDGIFLQSHDVLANLKAAKVKSISILRDRYYLGSQIFQGIMIVQTKENDFDKYLNEDYILQNKLLANQPIKNYFKQQYNNLNLDESAHTPDFRRQLLWVPNEKLPLGKTEIKFYTSDISGEFELRIQGLNADGLPVSFVKTFMVE